MIGFRSTSRLKTRVGVKAVTGDGKVTLLNLDNKRVFRELQRHNSLASSTLMVVAPFFQGDDGVVELGGVVSTRATTLVLDVTALNFTRTSGVAGTGVVGTATVGAADITNPRVDTVVVDTTNGAYSVIAGVATPGASLFNLQGKGAVPANRIVLAYVLVPANATTLTAAALADARP